MPSVRHSRHTIPLISGTVHIRNTISAGRRGCRGLGRDSAVTNGESGEEICQIKKERKKGDCATAGLDGKHLGLIAPQMVFKAKADGMSD